VPILPKAKFAICLQLVEENEETLNQAESLGFSLFSCRISFLRFKFGMIRESIGRLNLILKCLKNPALSEYMLDD
jgi:hypothetical protein